MDAPTADELRANPVVQAAFRAAWADSFSDDPALRHEEGGYVYANPATGQVIVRRAAPGGEDWINLSFPPGVPGCFLVAVYHTHPTRAATGGMPDPSPADYALADGSGVPWFVIAEEDTIYGFGPDRRVGGLSGRPGYPV